MTGGEPGARGEAGPIKSGAIKTSPGHSDDRRENMLYHVIKKESKKHSSRSGFTEFRKDDR